MQNVFDEFDLTPEMVQIASQMHYNREQRRKGSFMIIQNKRVWWTAKRVQRFGRWNHKRKRVIWHRSIQKAAAYSFRSVMTIWQLEGMSDNIQVMMRHKHPKLGVILV